MRTTKKEISKMIVVKNGCYGRTYSFYRSISEMDSFSEIESIVFRAITSFTREVNDFTKKDIVNSIMDSYNAVYTKQ